MWNPELMEIMQKQQSPAGKQPCAFFMKGICKYTEDKCKWSHDIPEELEVGSATRYFKEIREDGSSHRSEQNTTRGWNFGWRVNSTTKREGRFNEALLELASIPEAAKEINLEGFLKKPRFSHTDLIRAITHPLPTPEIARYLCNWDKSDVCDRINLPYHDFPPLFYASETHDCKLVRLLIEMGARYDVCGRDAIPLLPWIILKDHPRSSQVVGTLLSLGCNANTIPPYMYEDVMRVPADAVAEDFLPTTPWCTPSLRVELARRMNLSHRYLLNKASRLKAPSPRRLQTARHLKISGLFGMPYFVVGQEIATEIVCSSVISHLCIKSSHPLVMAFVGPPGHGKTELARQMGELLSAEIKVIDCTEMRYETDLLGPKAPYRGHQAGSPLNNHLANGHGKRTVVFLDEFDKTTEEVRQSLLIVLDQGIYKDRRDPSQEYDCGNTIWILATNLGDRVIQDFCQNSPRLGGELSPVHVDDLSSKIRNIFLQTFKGPLTGRITAIVPFLNFNAVEQAMMVHKLFLSFAAELRAPVCFRESRLIGGINLKMGVHPADGDSPVCALLAQKGYHPGLGARSLEQVIDRFVKKPLCDAALEGDEIVDDEKNTGPLMLYSVDHRPIGEQGQGVIIVRRLASGESSGEC